MYIRSIACPSHGLGHNQGAKPTPWNPVLTHPGPAGSSTPLLTNIMSQQHRPVVKRARRKAYLKRQKEAAKKQHSSKK